MCGKRIIVALLMLSLLCPCLSACLKSSEPEETEPSSEMMDEQTNAPVENSPEETDSPVTEEEPEPIVQTPVDIETDGGVVIVGTICFDDSGWYIKPDQPLNITFEYFLDDPSVFPEQTRVKMFDPKDDGVEKAHYIGQTVTVTGSFRFFRDDFETLYLSVYSVTFGKIAEKSYGAPGLMIPDESADLYDPTSPLPAKMSPAIQNGVYVYNPYMLSRETLSYLGNDFADFYVSLVDAFLNYETEVACPDKNYAEMLSTVIYYEFPMYNACARPFEFFKHYDAEKGTVTIDYMYDEQKHLDIIEEFTDAANSMLADTTQYQSDAEKAKNVYHAVSSRMTYDNSAMTEFERKNSYYAYLHNSGVCVTFANVYNQLLNCVGIETTVAHCDNPDTVGHSWSVVTVNGEWYFCDPTYELSYDSGNGYRFFGMNYAERTADGLGSMGIFYGRYYMRPMDESMIASESLDK